MERASLDIALDNGSLLGMMKNMHFPPYKVHGSSANPVLVSNDIISGCSGVLTLPAPSLRPLLCYRLFYYDHCSSFLVPPRLLTDKPSVMEMGRRGCERCPWAQTYGKKMNSSENYGNGCIWGVWICWSPHPLQQDVNRILEMGCSRKQ